ncbi:MAG TPA: DNA recombination/repair protein RecA, partial [Patescibacteria group bacterium]|nr:DNA recombination/repair protein RecA [Patescibacteria group bacterium]
MAAKIAEKPSEKPQERNGENKAAEAAKVAAARMRELDAAISTITKAYGEGSIMRLGDAHALKQIEVIPTGALAVDL